MCFRLDYFHIRLSEKKTSKSGLEKRQVSLVYSVFSSQWSRVSSIEVRQKLQTTSFGDYFSPFLMVCVSRMVSLLYTSPVRRTESRSWSYC